MAIYHLHAKIFARGQGHSVVQKSAYRSGTRLKDHYYNEIHDYSKRKGIESEIIAPVNSPTWVFDREKLWNKVELFEKRYDSQLAREIEFSLPKELEKDVHKDMVREFVKENFVSRGMIADIGFHHNDSNNPHTHIMLTLRKIKSDSFGEKQREWNKSNLLIEWRKNWSEKANKYLADYNIDEKIDHRSYKDRGIDKIAKVNIGYKAHALEKKGIRTEPGDINREIDKYNKLVGLKRKFDQKLEKKEILINDIDRILKESKNKYDFMLKMRNLGYYVNWKHDNKYITYTNPDGYKYRDRRLPDRFSKNNMEKYFIKNFQEKKEKSVAVDNKDYKEDLINLIEYGLKRSKSKYEFMEALKSKRFFVCWKHNLKELTYTAPNGIKYTEKDLPEKYNKKNMASFFRKKNKKNELNNYDHLIKKEKENFRKLGFEVVTIYKVRSKRNIYRTLDLDRKTIYLNIRKPNYINKKKIKTSKIIKEDNPVILKLINQMGLIDKLKIKSKEELNIFRDKIRHKFFEIRHTENNYNKQRKLVLKALENIKLYKEHENFSKKRKYRFSIEKKVYDNAKENLIEMGVNINDEERLRKSLKFIDGKLEEFKVSMKDIEEKKDLIFELERMEREIYKDDSKNLENARDSYEYDK